MRAVSKKYDGKTDSDDLEYWVKDRLDGYKIEDSIDLLQKVVGYLLTKHLEANPSEIREIASDLFNEYYEFIEIEE